MSASTIDFSKYESAAPAIDFSKYEAAAPAATAQPKTYKDTPAGAAEQMADMLGESVKSLAKVSGPNVMYEVLRKNFPQFGLKPVLGMPSADEVGAAGITFLAGAEEGAPEAPEATAAKPTPEAATSTTSLLDHPGVSPWVDFVKHGLKKELMKIPGADFAETALKSVKGFAEGAEPPTPPTPTVPSVPAAAIPETNGVQWGSGGQGPLDLRGKMIPSGQLPPLDATAENKPYAGESAKGRKVPQELQGLRQITQATVDKAVPPTGDTSELNAFVKTQVDNHLAQGDITGAESLIDTAAKTAESKWTPPQRPRIIPSVQNIRENIAQVNAAEAQPNRFTPDSMEDYAIQQDMAEDLERHRWAAESEARREFIARNSTGVTKADLTGAVEKPVKYTKTPGVPSPGTAADADLTDLLQRSLEAAKKAKAQQ